MIFCSWVVVSTELVRSDHMFSLSASILINPHSLPHLLTAADAASSALHALRLVTLLGAPRSCQWSSSHAAGAKIVHLWVRRTHPFTSTNQYNLRRPPWWAYDEHLQVSFRSPSIPQKTNSFAIICYFYRKQRRRWWRRLLVAHAC